MIDATLEELLRQAEAWVERERQEAAAQVTRPGLTLDPSGVIRLPRRLRLVKDPAT